MITPSASSLALFTVLISQVYAKSGLGLLRNIISSQSGISFIGCTPGQEAQINKAAIVANDLITVANENLKGFDAGNTNPSIRYRTWFGDYNALRSPVIMRHFQNMNNAATSLIYDCGPCPPADPELKYEVYAYPQKDNGKFTGTVNLCSGFWKAKLVGSGVYVTQAGIIIWKLSEIDSGGIIQDTNPVEAVAKYYANREPEMAYKMGPNYMYFAENIQLV